MVDLLIIGLTTLLRILFGLKLGNIEKLEAN